MAVDTLRCRICEAEYPAVASGVCLRCFGPLEPVYDWERSPAGDRASRSRRPALALALRGAAPDAAPPSLGGRPGWTPLVPAPRLAQRARGRRGVPEARPHEPDALVQGPRRRRRCGEGRRARGTDTLACASTGNLGNAVAARAAASGMRSVVLYPRTVEPEKLLATAVYGGEMYAVRGSYDDCSRLVVELAGELDWAFVNVNLRAYYAEGSKTLAFEIAEQLGWELPDAVVVADRLGLALHEALAGLRAVPRLVGPRRRGQQPAASIGGQAEGCAPVAHAFADDRPRVAGHGPEHDRPHSLAIGRPRRRRPRDRDGRAASGGSIYAVAEDEIGANLSMLAWASGVFGETAAGVTVGALAARLPTRRARPSHDRRRVLVTREPASRRRAQRDRDDAAGPHEIEASMPTLRSSSCSEHQSRGRRHDRLPARRRDRAGGARRRRCACSSSCRSRSRSRAAVRRRGDRRDGRRRCRLRRSRPAAMLDAVLLGAVGGPKWDGGARSARGRTARAAQGARRLREPAPGDAGRRRPRDRA